VKFYRAAPLSTIPVGHGTAGGAGLTGADAAGLPGGAPVIAIRVADLVLPAGQFAAETGRTALVVARSSARRAPPWSPPSTPPGSAHRADPRPGPRRRPPGRPRPQGPPRRAESPAPRNLVHRRAARRAGQHPIRRRDREPARPDGCGPPPRNPARPGQTPDRHRPPPAPRPKNQDLPGIPRRRTRHHHAHRDRASQPLHASRGLTAIISDPSPKPRRTQSPPPPERQPGRTHARHAPQPNPRPITLCPERRHER
jgi:hypothetical protein